MRICTLALVVSLIVVQVSCNVVQGENRVRYAINIARDGSATWVIEQTGTDIQVSPDTLAEFQNKVLSLVEDAQTESQRNMTANVTSITSIISGSYANVKYEFLWEGFGRIQDTLIVIDDVFQVEDFFLQLFGDGEICLTYPSQYEAETVTPMPYKRDDSIQLLEWLGTANFASGQSVIVLRERPQGFFEILEGNAVAFGSLVALVIASSCGIYLFRRRKKRDSRTTATEGLADFTGIESDEERIVRLLKSSGGSLLQSAIGDQCRFSRAKTSQLLSVLESKRLVTRYKRGRDKVVVLVKENGR